MSKLLEQIKKSVKEKALEEAFKSDDGVSTNPDVAFDKRKDVPAKKDLKKTGPDLPGDVDNVAADNAKIEKGKDAAKEDNKKDINHKKFTQKDKASVIGEDFGKFGKDKNVDADDDNEEVDNDDNDNDDNGEDNAGKEVKIEKPEADDSDADADGDQEVDIRVRKVTKEDVNVEEHLAALLGREKGLSEEFKSRAKNIFEAAVIDAANTVLEEVIPQLVEAQEAEQEQFVESLVEKMDDYLDKVVSEWLEENRVEIQSNVRTEIAESFLVGLKDLFEQHYIEIPEEKADIVTEMVGRIEALEASLDEEINKNVALENELTEARKEVLVTEHLEGLSENQKERIRMLAEGIELTSEDTFIAQLEDLKEAYTQDVKTTSVDHDDTPVVLAEDIADEKSKKLAANPIGESIAASMTKVLRKR